MNANRVCRWEHFSHDADIGIRGYGDSIEAAFTQAALAMTGVICDISTVKPIRSREITCEAQDFELLFVDWLNALIYNMAVEQMLFSRFEIQIQGMVLHATVWGESVDRIRHQPAVEVKGATFTGLEVTHAADDQWMAQCVIDV